MVNDRKVNVRFAGVPRTTHLRERALIAHAPVDTLAAAGLATASDAASLHARRGSV
jgi:hypothetical protein